MGGTFLAIREKMAKVTATASGVTLYTGELLRGLSLNLSSLMERFRVTYLSKII